MRSHLPGTLALVFFWFASGVHAQECGAGRACATELAPSPAASGTQQGADQAVAYHSEFFFKQGWIPQDKVIHAERK